VGKPLEKCPFGRPRGKPEDTMKINHIEICFEGGN
jgi:hypothetical protein